MVDAGDGPALAAGLDLATPWPNPIAAAATLHFRLPAEGPARLSVHDVSGREVAVVQSGRLEAGGHSARWDGRDARGREVGNGIYFFRLEAGGQTVVRKGLVIR